MTADSAAVPRHISHNLAKLAMLCLAEEGWDTDSSQPAHRRAIAGYLESGLWAAAGDGEPMLTDEGEIRLEWERGEDDHTVEIGSIGMYLARLRDSLEDSDCTAPLFDADALIDFAASDVMPAQEELDAEAVNVFDTLADRRRSCIPDRVHRRAVRAAGITTISDDEVIEHLAAAMWGEKKDLTAIAWEGCSDETKQTWRSRARTALTTLRHIESVAVPKQEGKPAP